MGFVVSTALYLLVVTSTSLPRVTSAATTRCVGAVTVPLPVASTKAPPIGLKISNNVPAFRTFSSSEALSPERILPADSGWMSNDNFFDLGSASDKSSGMSSHSGKSWNSAQVIRTDQDSSNFPFSTNFGWDSVAQPREPQSLDISADPAALNSLPNEDVFKDFDKTFARIEAEQKASTFSIDRDMGRIEEQAAKLGRRDVPGGISQVFSKTFFRQNEW